MTPAQRKIAESRIYDLEIEGFADVAALLRELAAEPQSEPVAWRHKADGRLAKSPALLFARGIERAHGIGETK